MSITTILANEDDRYAERWRQWEQRNAESSRQAAKRARIVSTVVLTALAAWLAVQLLASQPWA